VRGSPAGAAGRRPATLGRAALKSIRAKLDEKDLDGAKAALSKTVSMVDRMAKTGIIHRNTAGRYKSRLASHLERAAK
jgi:small subunit ribosomal protein S20